ncbi:MAG: molybdate ABC transporter substrate-binding protein [bacterium]
MLMTVLAAMLMSPFLPWMEPGPATAGGVAVGKITVPVGKTTVAGGELAGGKLIVAAASSLQGPFRELARAFALVHGQRTTLVFGASGSLAHQIGNGAPYDVFASADEQWIKQLAARGRIDPDSVAVYAVGRLALVTHRPQDMAGLPELLTARHLGLLTGPGIKVIALANPRYAPYGAAAREVLRKAGLWERLAPRLVFGQNVRQTLTYVESGNADAALVAASMTPRGARPWPLISAALHPPIRQAVGRVSKTPRPEAARRFIAFLLSAAGRDILRAYRLHLPSSSLPATKARFP